MKPLTLEQLRSRLALDYRAMRSLRGPAIGRVEPFVSALDIPRRRLATEAQGLAGLVTAYRVEFTFPMLNQSKRTLSRAHALFVLPASNYPYASPSVHFESGAIPFAPHFQPQSGSVCLGPGWMRAEGESLLVHLVVHVMRLANFDEPSIKDGNHPAAYEYATQVLGGRPLNPDMDYPATDERVTHSGTPPALPAAGAFFRASVAPSRPIFASGSTNGFRRRTP